MQTVHVRVNDAATGQATPVRIRFSDAAGNYYAPFGRLTEFPIGAGQDVGGNLQFGDKKYAYIDGACEIALPPGKISVEIYKGPEYRSIVQEIDHPAGKMAMRFQIERWTDMRKQGWYSGDCRAHFLTPHAALLEGQAEDLAVVNLMIAEWRMSYENASWDSSKELLLSFTTIDNMAAFSGQHPALEDPGCMVVVNTCNRHPVLGSLGLLNCHRPVFPLRFGGPDGLESWTLADWCDQCHRKEGLVVWIVQRYLIGAEVILGKVDVLEVNIRLVATFALMREWYDLLNSGVNLPLVASGSKDGNWAPLGAMRTYARLKEGEAITYKNWIEAARAGRTFVTNGPLLTVTVEDREPGAVIDLAAPGDTLHVYAMAESLTPFEKLELVLNGEVIQSCDAGGEPCRAVLESDIAVPEGGWIAARCWGGNAAHGAFIGDYAHTSPVYIHVNGRPPPAKPEAVARLLGHLDEMLRWVDREARFENDRQRQNLLHIFHDAREVLTKRLAAQ